MGERRGTKALELWCRRMVEDYNVRIDNMTVSWRDGLAFCALVSKCLTLKGLPCDLMWVFSVELVDVHKLKFNLEIAEIEMWAYT